MSVCLLEAGQIAYSLHVYYSAKWKWLAFTIDPLGILANIKQQKALYLSSIFEFASL